MPGLWWQSNVQLRLGLKVTGLPERCPDCGIRNTEEHALGDVETGGCGGARNRRHDEFGKFMMGMYKEAGYHVVEGEPEVPKVRENDPATRCDGIVRGLTTPQRETWVDFNVTDTGAPSNLMTDPELTLRRAEDGKRKKHGWRLTAHNADFLPIVCSVYGTMAFNCQQTIKACTEKMMAGESRECEDVAQVLHLNRARVQAAVWKATALGLVGRRGREQETAVRQHGQMVDETAEWDCGLSIPWLCVASDAGIRAPR